MRCEWIFHWLFDFSEWKFQWTEWQAVSMSMGNWRWTVVVFIYLFKLQIIEIGINYTQLLIATNQLNIVCPGNFSSSFLLFICSGFSFLLLLRLSFFFLSFGVCLSVCVCFSFSPRWNFHLWACMCTAHFSVLGFLFDVFNALPFIIYSDLIKFDVVNQKQR